MIIWRWCQQLWLYDYDNDDEDDNDENENDNEVILNNCFENWWLCMRFHTTTHAM